jgi:hypothetical protein
MKKFWILGIVMMVLFGSMITSCDNGTTDDIVPIELQGTWVNPAGTVTITRSSVTVAITGGTTNTDNVVSVQKGSVVNISGTNYTSYTVILSQGYSVYLGLTQDGQTMLDDDGYIFTKV